jgi:hypothetical protein
VKSIIRLLGVAILISGWAVAALSLHVVRTPDPNDPKKSKLLVIPKARLGVFETYVDARHWTMADVPNHAALVLRILDAGMADQLKFLGDPDSRQGIQTQLIDALPRLRGRKSPATASSMAPSGTSSAGFDLGGLLDLPISF